MPRTVIFQQTWMCPNGIGKNDPVLGIPEGTCRAQGPEGAICSIHKVPLVRATLMRDLAAKTVMGEEDIEIEIAQERTTPRGIDVSSAAAANLYRARRRQDIARVIVEARVTEHKP